MKSKSRFSLQISVSSVSLCLKNLRKNKTPRFALKPQKNKTPKRKRSFRPLMKDLAATYPRRSYTTPTIAKTAFAYAGRAGPQLMKFNVPQISVSLCLKSLRKNKTARFAPRTPKKQKAETKRSLRLLMKDLAPTYSRRTYRTTTIGKTAFDGRVRDGNGSDRSFMGTKKPFGQ